MRERISRSKSEMGLDFSALVLNGPKRALLHFGHLRWHLSYRFSKDVFHSAQQVSLLLTVQWCFWAWLFSGFRKVYLKSPARNKDYTLSWRLHNLNHFWKYILCLDPTRIFLNNYTANKCLTRNISNKITMTTSKLICFP